MIARTENYPGTNSLYLSYFLGISRLRGTTLYELFLTYQQRGLNWYHKAERGAKDILSVFQVHVRA